MRKVGYARVSSASQNLDRQLGALRAERCDVIYQEKVTAKSLKGRPQLEKAIDAPHRRRAGGSGVGSSDQVHDGWHSDRRPRARPRRAGEGAGQAAPGSHQHHRKGLLAFLSAIAQDETERIAKRANEGRAAAKAMGGRFGRKPKLDDHQQAEALERLAAGEI
jgi:DNA invertase Pin-like site-specific DNA recombinase